MGVYGRANQATRRWRRAIISISHRYYSDTDAIYRVCAGPFLARTAPFRTSSWGERRVVGQWHHGAGSRREISAVRCSRLTPAHRRCVETNVESVGKYCIRFKEMYVFVNNWGPPPFWFRPDTSGAFDDGESARQSRCVCVCDCVCASKPFFLVWP